MKKIIMLASMNLVCILALIALIPVVNGLKWKESLYFFPLLTLTLFLSLFLFFLILQDLRELIDRQSSSKAEALYEQLEKERLEYFSRQQRLLASRIKNPGFRESVQDRNLPYCRSRLINSLLASKAQWYQSQGYSVSIHAEIPSDDDYDFQSLYARLSLSLEKARKQADKAGSTLIQIFLANKEDRLSCQVSSGTGWSESFVIDPNKSNEVQEVS